jgi:hypothetical protein
VAVVGVRHRQAELRDLKQDLVRCIREPFFVFLTTTVVPAGRWLSGVVVLALDRPLALDSVYVRLRGVARSEFGVPHALSGPAGGGKGTARASPAAAASSGGPSGGPGAGPASTTTLPAQTARTAVATATVCDVTQAVLTPQSHVLSAGVHRVLFQLLVPRDALPSVSFAAHSGRVDGAREATHGCFSVSYEVSCALRVLYAGHSLAVVAAFVEPECLCMCVCALTVTTVVCR